MSMSELAGLMERAEHLLWILARSDVEDLPEQRRAVLERLHAVEVRASQLGIPDLYEEIFQSQPRHD